MRNLAFATALVAVAALPQAEPASATEAYIPPIVEATVTAVSSQALADGTWWVTIEANVVNTSDAPLDGVELMLIDAAGLQVGPPSEPVAVGDMAVLDPLAVALEFEAPEAVDSLDGLPLVIAGSAVDTVGEAIAVLVEVQEEVAQ